jgi:hypothetical protein
MKTAEIMNVKEAAELIGCTTGRIRQLLLAGELRGLKFSPRAWAVSRKDALRVARLEHGTGRPRSRRQPAAAR